MRRIGVGNKQAYDCYEHFFPGLALWHLRFNYLKMVWEIFYLGGSASERSTLQWAVDHWHWDKTTRPTDFHSFEDFTIHSYRSRIVAILKSWIYQQNHQLHMHDSKELGEWLSKLSFAYWDKAMKWLRARKIITGTIIFVFARWWKRISLYAIPLSMGILVFSEV